MRRFSFVEPGDDGYPVETVVSEAEIERLYYPYWLEQMRKAGHEVEINKDSLQMCIDDFIVVHWAEELKEGAPSDIGK